MTARLDITPLMPRHRKERVPWHRALRQAGSPARRARLTPAVDTAIAVLEDSRREDPDGAETVPLAASARATPGHARSRRHPGVKRHRVLHRSTRGLLVTPWFAAASGFVIAASLWIYSPHAQLQFPNNNNAIHLQHCHNRCTPAGSQNGSGSLASSGKHRLTDSQKSGATGAGNPAISSMTFSYFVVPSPDGQFTIRISVTGKHAIKAWRLSFVLPGDRIGSVSGADWQRISRDSGTASGEGGQAGQWTGYGPDPQGHSAGDDQPYGFTFLVSGAGRPVAPTRCRYDGQACAFRAGRQGPSGTR